MYLILFNNVIKDKESAKPRQRNEIVLVELQSYIKKQLLAI